MTQEQIIAALEAKRQEAEALKNELTRLLADTASIGQFKSNTQNQGVRELQLIANPTTGEGLIVRVLLNNGHRHEYRTMSSGEHLLPLMLSAGIAQAEADVELRIAEISQRLGL